MGGYGLPQHVRISVGLEHENRRLIAVLEQVLQTKTMDVASSKTRTATAD
jgi:histidinol-phosphate/aromatic aminotransferase/cobyric acid decarboxylase-like protein